jgi:aspartyl-tRNA(Asn)/glutamyl-tRNA(Gln) amidotransferase subunit A
MKAQKIRRLVQQEFDSVFSMKNPLHDHPDCECDEDTNSGSVDVLICPTAPNMPPKLSDVKVMSAVESYMTDVFTVPASLAGLPAISVPLDIDGLGSAGIQIIGQFGADEQVLAVAQLFEEWGMTGRCTAESIEV